jgi:hypothetical protein
LRPWQPSLPAHEFKRGIQHLCQHFRRVQQHYYRRCQWRGVRVTRYIADAQAIQSSVITSGTDQTNSAIILPPSETRHRHQSLPLQHPPLRPPSETRTSTPRRTRTSWTPPSRSPIMSSHIQWRVPNPSPPTRMPRPWLRVAHNAALRTNAARPRLPSPPSLSAASSLNRSAVSTLAAALPRPRACAASRRPAAAQHH